MGPGRDRAVAVDGAGERPGPELGAHRVHGAVRPGDAGPDQRLQPAAAGDPSDQRAVSRPDLPRAELAGRPRRGVAAVAPGLHRVLQAAGFRGGPAQAQMAEFDTAQMADRRSRARLPRHV